MTQTFSSAALQSVTAMIPTQALTFWAAIWAGVLVTSIPESAIWALFALGVIGTGGWVYHSVTEQERDPDPNGLAYQCVAAMIAFAVWAYYLASISVVELEGPIVLDQGYAFMLMVGYTFIVPLLPLYAATLMLIAKLLTGRGKQGSPTV